MPTIAVIPVKSFATGNQRLAPKLGETERASLGRSYAAHVAETAESAGLLPLIVTADTDVAAWATSLGFPSIPDPGEGLDAAAAAGVVWSLQTRSRWIIVHSDLPLLEPADLEALIAAPGDAIAPSADGGTSAISAAGPMEFTYGPGSFHRHLARLENPRIVTRLGFLHDVDSPADLESVQSHQRRMGAGP